VATRSSKFKVQSSKLNNAPKATSMAELMRSAKTTFVTPRKGDAVPGIITKLTRSEILVDINAKTEAVVLEKDRKILSKILSSLKTGDKVVVTILNPEGDLGNSVVSLRKFIDDIVWEKLLSLQKAKEVLEVTVDSATKGGFLVTTLDGISGFLPNSHSSTLENPLDAIGKNIKTVVLEFNRELHKIIFSQKQVLGIDDFKKSIKIFKIGQKIDAIVSNITSFGMFLAIQTNDREAVEGFIHLSEVSWETVSNIEEFFKVSQKIKAVITGFDEDSRRILLSIKRLTANPLEAKLKEYAIDKKIKGEVIKIISAGVLLDLGEGVVGIINKDKIPPNMSYKEGLSVDVVVSKIDNKRHRVLLTPVLLEKPIGYR
jgi:ribosomal protein S1